VRRNQSLLVDKLTFRICRNIVGLSFGQIYPVLNNDQISAEVTINNKTTLKLPTFERRGYL